MRIIEPGSTSNLFTVNIFDAASTTGGGKTGLVYNTAGLTYTYHRSNAAASVGVTLATMTLGTWATGGFKEIDSSGMPGEYQIGLPDAACASGAKYVTVHLKGAANMVPCAVCIPLNVGEVVAKQVIDSTYPASSIGKRLSALGDPDGTAQAGAATTMTLAASASSVDDYYKRLGFAIIRGTGAGQFAICKSYVGATKVATMTTTWFTNPDATSEYIVVPIPNTYSTIIEEQGNYTAQQALSIILSAVAGTSPSGGVFKTPNDSATRISGSVTTGGVRSAITLTPSA